MKRTTICCVLLACAVALSVAGCRARPARKRAATATRPAAKSETVPTSPELQAQRLAFIQKLTARGLFTTVEQPATLPHVWITPAFRSLDYRTQNKFLGVVFAYYYAGTSGPKNPLRDYGRIVVLKDSQTGKRIGSFSRMDAGLKYD